MTFRPSSRFAPLLIYQIYPSSFHDSNGDGIGDLAGITAKLDYLEWFGVDAIWISPICVSPGRDMGYDISDYCNIDPRYGTLQDFDLLVKEAKKRNIKILMDLVVNHTSDEHAWFRQDALSQLNPSKPNEYHDFYIWRQPHTDPETGERKPPNNWKSIFQGSVWEPHPSSTTKPVAKKDSDSDVQLPMYLHLYMPSQPDLNWENPRVRDAVWDVMKFWLDRGAGGFRMDVINLISKHPDLPDAPVTNPNEEWQYAPMYFANGPRIHEFLHEMDDKVLSQYSPRPLTIGEAPHTYSMRTLAQYVLPTISSKSDAASHDKAEQKHAELDMVFHFELVLLDAAREGGVAPPMATGDYAAAASGETGSAQDFELPTIPTTLMHQPFTLTELKEVTSRWQRYKPDKGFWNSLYLENHDQPRSVSRFALMSIPSESSSLNATSPPEPTLDPSVKRALLSKLLALHLTTLCGTLFVYQGQEIGMSNFSSEWGLNEYKDGSTVRFWNAKRLQKMKLNGGVEPDMSDILDHLRKKARDHSRTPMQWDSSPFAGFISQPNAAKATPWMRVNDDYTSGWNVAAQKEDKASVLNFWRGCIRTRKSNIDSLVYGDFTLLDPDGTSPAIFAYTRTSGTLIAIVVLNFSAGPSEFSITEHFKRSHGYSNQATYKLVLRTYDAVETEYARSDVDECERSIRIGHSIDGRESILKMRPYEGRLYTSTRL